MSDTLCWRCENATGYCSWSSELVPVKGWKATKGNISYHVKSCPEFKPDRPFKITKDKVAKMMGFSRRTLYRLSDSEVQRRIAQRDLPLIYDEVTKIFYMR